MYGYEEDDYDEEDDDICEFCGCGPYDSPKCPACKGCGGMFNPGTEECDWCEYSEECEEALLMKIEMEIYYRGMKLWTSLDILWTRGRQ